MSLAPIILFVYNRPWHTQQTVEALQKNELAAESDLFIFADGPKPNASEECLANISKVRNYIHKIDGFKSITIEESPENKGLANSVITGVTKIINQFGKVIVVEDDIVTHPFFLRFMNEALETYNHNKKIYTIGGTSIKIEIPPSYSYDVFIAPRVESWGWATWKDRWSTANWDISSYPIIKNPTKKRIKRICKGGDDFWPMLKSQMKGTVDSWAVRWQYNMIENNGMCLFPTNSFICNIGCDSTGTNCGAGSVPLRPIYNGNKSFDYTFVKDIAPNRQIIKNIQDYYQIHNTPFHKRITDKLKGKILSINNQLKQENHSMHYGYFGDYSSFKEVLSLCDGYSSNNILEKTLQATLKVKKGEAVFERDSFIFNKIQYSYPLLSCLFKVAVECNNSLSIVDFGGALGSHYFQNRDFLKPITLKQWIVVEQPSYVKIGNELIADDILKFDYSINNAYDFNLLLSSSTLQYMENPYEQARKFVDSGIKYILLDRIQLNKENRDRLTLQIVSPEIYEAKYPSWFLSEEKLLSVFKNDYELILDFDSTIDTANIPSMYKGYLFKKNV